MKYIITESKIYEGIETFILNTFPEVHKIYFTKHKKSLGSTEGFPVVEETRINIIIDNSKNELHRANLNDLMSRIMNATNDMFSLKIWDYGSKWDFRFSQLSVVKLDTPIVWFSKIDNQ